MTALVYNETKYCSFRDVIIQELTYQIRGAQYILKSCVTAKEVLNTLSRVTLARKMCPIHSKKLTYR